LESRVNALIDAGNKGIIVNSRMAGTYITSSQKRLRLIELVSGCVKARNSDVKVIADITSGNHETNIKSLMDKISGEAKGAGEVGADYVLIYPFYYSSIDAVNIEEYFPQIISSYSPLTIIANDPKIHNGTEKGDIPLVHIRNLAWNTKVYGILDNSGNADYREGFCGELPKDFHVFDVKLKE